MSGFLVLSLLMYRASTTTIWYMIVEAGSREWIDERMNEQIEITNNEHNTNTIL